MRPTASCADFGVVLYDITDRKAAETALERSALHLRSILATVPDAMIVIGRARIIYSFSAAAERLFGWTEADVVGPQRLDADARARPPAPRFLSRTLSLHRRAARDRHRPHRRGPAARRHRFPDGAGRSARRAARGHRIFTGFIRDLTAQQRAELQLKELQSELIHVSRLSAMGTMASTLAHELNQPLTAIANYMEASRDLLARPPEDGPAAEMLREAIEESAREALRAGNIVRRLRDFVARGDVDKHVEDLPQLIDEASRLALVGARERGVRAFFEPDPAVTAVLVDRVQIQQVLLNLVRNAIDAMADCDVRDVTVTTIPDAAAWFASRSPTPARESIRRWRRNCSRPSRARRSGAWDWGCRSAGRSWSRTEGAIWAVRGRAAARYSTSPSWARVRRKRVTEKRIIHLVDDEESIRRSAGFMLRTSGYDVKAYASGVEFLKEAKRRRRAASCSTCGCPRWTGSRSRPS